MKVFIFILVIALATQVQSQQIMPLNGTRLFVHVEGTGEPLLIVHGGPGLNHTYFLPHLEKLKTKFKLIYYDQRASGLSAIPSTDSIRLRFFVNDIEAIRQALNLRSLNILAHSWGIIPAILYGKAYPQRVKRIILCNPVPLSREYDQVIGDLQKKRTTRRDSIDRATILQSAAFKEGNIESIELLMKLAFRHSFSNPENLEKLKIDLPGNYQKASRALFAGLSEDLSANFYDSLNQFKPHLMLMVGAKDILPEEALNQLNKMVPSVRYVFEESGHFIFIEEPELFQRRVESFILRK